MSTRTHAQWRPTAHPPLRITAIPKQGARGSACGDSCLQSQHWGGLGWGTLVRGAQQHYSQSPKGRRHPDIQQPRNDHQTTGPRLKKLRLSLKRKEIYTHKQDDPCGHRAKWKTAGKIEKNPTAHLGGTQLTSELGHKGRGEQWSSCLMGEMRTPRNGLCSPRRTHLRQQITHFKWM